MGRVFLLGSAHRRGRAALACLLGLAALLLPAAARADRLGWLGGDLEIADRNGDAAAAAGAISVVGAIKGDALLAGGEVLILGEVSGDVRALTGRYEQTGPAYGEVSVGARSVVLDGVVGDDFWAAGKDVEVRGETRISEDARIIAEDVLVRGRIDGNLNIVADQVAFDGQVGGDVAIEARRIVLGPNATIDGKLTWRSPEEPLTAPEAIIRGGVKGERRPPPLFRWQGIKTESVLANVWLAKLAGALSAFLLGGLLMAAAPRFWKSSLASCRSRWFWSAPFGGAGLAGLGLAAGALAVTAFGAPLAIAALLALPLALLASYAIAAAAIGGVLVELAPRRKPAWAGLAAGVLLFGLLSVLPWLGGLVTPFACLFGLGGALLAQWRAARA